MRLIKIGFAKSIQRVSMERCSVAEKLRIFGQLVASFGNSAMFERFRGQSPFGAGVEILSQAPRDSSSPISGDSHELFAPGRQGSSRAGLDRPGVPPEQTECIRQRLFEAVSVI